MLIHGRVRGSIALETVSLEPQQKVGSCLNGGARPKALHRELVALSAVSDNLPVTFS